jgi:ketosteroid isomerase-like protein
MSEQRTTNEIADAIFDAIERGDMEMLASMWADDVEVWHSNDNVVQNKEQNLAVLDWMATNTASVEYVDIVRDITTTGFVQRHVLRLTFDGGRTADLHVAIFVAISNGQVNRIDEYLDSAHVAAAMALLR